METYTDFGVSYLIQTFVKKINITLWNDCRVILSPLSPLPSPPPLLPEFQIFRKNMLHFVKRAKMCCSNRSRGVYRLSQGHMT